MNENMRPVVVIPVYKPQLSAYERISLARCSDILSAHNIVFVKPESLNFEDFLAETGFTAISFPDSYFESINGYNELLMSEIFYRSFIEYQFILIYQLDAFVFTDNLNYWCEQNYDYIGAPWLRTKSYQNIFNKAFSKTKNYLYMRYNAKYKDGMPKVGKQIEDRVGNGGLSLRKVSKFLDCCIKYKPLIDHYISLKHPWFNEDIFWSIELNRKKQNISKPALNKALQFSIETNPERAFRINHNKLPFGCHAWDKNTEFWYPIFKQLGYTI